MKWRSLFAVAVGAMILHVSAATAYVDVTLHHPAPPYNVEELWWADVYNDSTEAVTGRMKGEITDAGSGKVLFWAVTRQEVLSAKQRKTFRYQNIGIDSSDYDPSLKEFAFRTGGLPGGRGYRFRVWWYPNGDTGSTPSFTPISVGKPRLVSPLEGAKLGGPCPDFVWTPPANYSGRVTYKLRVVEVEPGQTGEEALAANLSWFEQGGINSTQFRYPASARKLYDSSKYAWQVSAEFGPGTASLLSGVRGFEQVAATPRYALVEHMKVTRRASREATHFKVFLDFTVNVDIKDLKVQVWNTGFQCIPPADAQNANTAATSGSGTRTKWWGSYGDKSGGTTFTLSSLAVPILLPTMPSYQWYRLCDSVVITYSQGGVYHILRPNLVCSPATSVDAAFGAADFVIVTCPEKLYPAYNTNDVDYLLSTCGQLATNKNGVLGYTSLSTTATQLGQMLRGSGVWGSELAPAFRTWSQGYVLLVGEQNIVPTWRITNMNVQWPDGKVTDEVRLSDYPYSDCTGDWIADLVVGRAIGRSALELSRVIVSAVTYSTTAKPASACLVSGYDDNPLVLWNFKVSVMLGAISLHNKGVPATWAHIGSLPPPVATKLGAVQSVVQGRKLICYRGHGWTNCWSDVLPSSSVGSLSYGTGAWIVAFSCNTGYYADNIAICRAFTNVPGTLGYIGSTEVSLGAINTSLGSGLFWSWYKSNGWSLGRALFKVKWVYPLFGTYGRLTAYEYNLYGCPK